MADIHGIGELRYAKKYCNDIPKIQKEIDKMLSFCYNYMEYTYIKEIHHVLVDSKTMLDVQYRYYKDVLNKKGKM